MVSAHDLRPDHGGHNRRGVASLAPVVVLLVQQPPQHGVEAEGSKIDPRIRVHLRVECGGHRLLPNIWQHFLHEDVDLLGVQRGHHHFGTSSCFLRSRPVALARGRRCAYAVNLGRDRVARMRGAGVLELPRASTTVCPGAPSMAPLEGSLVGIGIRRRRGSCGGKCGTMPCTAIGMLAMSTLTACANFSRVS